LRSRSRPFNEIGIEKDVDICAICIEKFTAEDGKLLAELNCDSRHIFHLDCLLEWVEKQEVCPLCRQEIKKGEMMGKDTQDIE
jgi:E3 ubiquitin-protein ligase DOA10